MGAWVGEGAHRRSTTSCRCLGGKRVSGGWMLARAAILGASNGTTTEECTEEWPRPAPRGMATPCPQIVSVDVLAIQIQSAKTSQLSSDHQRGRMMPLLNSKKKARPAAAPPRWPAWAICPLPSMVPVTSRINHSPPSSAAGMGMMPAGHRGRGYVCVRACSYKRHGAKPAYVHESLERKMEGACHAAARGWVGCSPYRRMVRVGKRRMSSTCSKQAAVSTPHAHHRTSTLGEFHA